MQQVVHQVCKQFILKSTHSTWRLLIRGKQCRLPGCSNMHQVTVRETETITHTKKKSAIDFLMGFHSCTTQILVHFTDIEKLD